MTLHVTAPHQIIIRAEQAEDAAARDALLDRAMGPGRRKKASEKLRRHRLPAEGLALVAQEECGRIVGSVRLWHVMAGTTPALLLGPLAVAPEAQGCGVGSKLMRRALAEAAFAGHGAILLVGDAPYYARFGFSAAGTSALEMPGPVDRARFLALELREGALAGASGMLAATGAFEPRRRSEPMAKAA
jgi:predicted N-acetyltransferase YhbS